MDVVFVADASSSVADPDFLVLCDLTTQIYRKFLTDIGDELRASMVTYASTVYEDHVISLNDYDRTTFQNKLCIQRVGFILHACVSKCSVKSICLRTTTALTAKGICSTISLFKLESNKNKSKFCQHSF